MVRVSAQNIQDQITIPVPIMGSLRTASGWCYGQDLTHPGKTLLRQKGDPFFSQQCSLCVPDAATMLSALVRASLGNNHTLGASGLEMTCTTKGELGHFGAEPNNKAGARSSEGLQGPARVLKVAEWDVSLVMVGAMGKPWREAEASRR